MILKSHFVNVDQSDTFLNKIQEKGIVFLNAFLENITHHHSRKQLKMVFKLFNRHGYINSVNIIIILNYV